MQNLFWGSGKAGELKKGSAVGYHSAKLLFLQSDRELKCGMQQDMNDLVSPKFSFDMIEL